MFVKSMIKRLNNCNIRISNIYIPNIFKNQIKIKLANFKKVEKI